MPEDTQIDRVLQFVEEQGVVSRAKVVEAGLRPEYLSRLEASEELIRIIPGIYMHPDHIYGPSLEFAAVTLRAPHAVIFGVSALQFHEVAGLFEHHIEIAIERGKWQPKFGWFSVDVYHLSSKSFSSGIEVHTVENHIDIQVYSVAKTIADLFKFRNSLGLDVAIQALQEGWRDKRFTKDEIIEFAKINRVHNVMRPFLEMLY